MRRRSLIPLVCLAAGVTLARGASPAGSPPKHGVASWYGEDHRGKRMANGAKFDPDRLTAASWFYPLGTKVEVRLEGSGQEPRRVVVQITDRGPAQHLVQRGRIIDLSQAAFRILAPLETGLVPVKVRRLDQAADHSPSEVAQGEKDRSG
jgi:peptidoglycan lytic transglycosylase